MEAIKNVARDWSLAVAAAVLVAIACVIGLSYLLHVLYPAFTYGPRTGEIVPPVVRAGDPIQICRDITVKRSIEYSVTRELVRRGNPEIRADFGRMEIARTEPAFISQCRVATVPYNLPPGRWTLMATVSYTDWPFWRTQQNVPEAEFRIIE